MFLLCRSVRLFTSWIVNIFGGKGFIVLISKLYHQNDFVLVVHEPDKIRKMVLLVSGDDL